MDLMYNYFKGHEITEGQELNCLYEARKWEIMYLCVSGIDYASFYEFSFGFSNSSDSVVFFCFTFYHNELFVR